MHANRLNVSGSVWVHITYAIVDGGKTMMEIVVKKHFLSMSICLQKSVS